MTKAKFSYQNHDFHTFEINGHADYNEEGLDIVCAGISATVITSLNLLMKLIGHSYKFNENQEEGYMHFEVTAYNFDQETKDFMNLVVSNLIESLQEIEEMYPNHLKVKIEK